MGKVFTKLHIGDTVATSGTRVFRKLITETLPDYGNAGLYDADDNLVASWNALVYTYGMDVEKTYTSSTYKTDMASPYYVLTKNSNLSAGTKMIIPDSVTSIGGYAFYTYNKLTDITLGNSIQSIGGYAFYKCSGLKNVHIASLYAWCNIVFKSVYANPMNYADYLYIGGVPLEGKVIIPNGVTQIYDKFKNCSGITEVIIPDSVTGIGSTAFSGCTSLTSIIIPNSVTRIDSYAFSLCTSLTSIIIPDSVTRIGENVFEYCKRLTSLTIPNSVTSVGKSLLYYATGIENVIVGDGIETIERYSFAHCSSLVSVTFGRNLTTIETSAFSNADRLKDVYYRGTEQRWAAITIDNWNDPLLNATIHYNYTG